MKQPWISKFLLLILVILNTPVLQGQTQTKADSYIWFDQIIGKSNSGIYTGTQYVEQHRMINDKHKFFDNPNFVTGSVVYDGQAYYDLELKYDLFSDQLLLRYADMVNPPTIILDKAKITSFTIVDKQFENLSFSSNRNTEVSGFVQILFSNGSLVLFKKLGKKISTKTSDKVRYYEFKDRHAYYFKYKNSYYEIDRLNDLIEVFPQLKADIKASEAAFELLKKENIDRYWVAIFENLAAQDQYANQKGL